MNEIDILVKQILTKIDNLYSEYQTRYNIPRTPIATVGFYTAVSKAIVDHPFDNVTVQEIVLDRISVLVESNVDLMSDRIYNESSIWK